MPKLLTYFIVLGVVTGFWIYIVRIQSKFKHAITFALVASPLWLPLAYLALMGIENSLMSGGRQGPFRQASLVAIFVSPLVSLIPILYVKQIPVIIRVLLSPGIYVVALLALGVIAWASSCWMKVDAC